MAKKFIFRAIFLYNTRRLYIIACKCLTFMLKVCYLRGIGSKEKKAYLHKGFNV